MENIIEGINRFVWGVPALVLILAVGLYLTWQLRFAQICLFPEALKRFCRQFIPQRTREGNSSFQALCAALGATVGTGNLIGVAGAICLGGPGAVFWMWICGILGMVTKYAEALLAVRYRVKTEAGIVGGPMYIITLGLPGKFRGLAWCYACFGVIASFGVGNLTQIHAATNAIQQAVSSFGCDTGRTFDLLLVAAFAVVIGTFLFGGAGRIYCAAELLVPLAAVIYILLCFGILLHNWHRLPDAFFQIFRGAFSPTAVTGGMIGSAFQALRIGCSRGVFTNEAGMGTAAIAHGASDVRHPVEQGLMGIMEVFLDTIVICTMTALVILCSGVKIPYGTDVGIALTAEAFSAVCGNWTSVAIAGALCCFAFATILGWGLYGARCAQYLFGPGAWRYFAVIQGIIVILGAMLKTGTVWILAEIFNGLMAIPNLITLAALSSELIRLTKDYTFFNGRKPAGGGNYESIHQCKPL